jgi:isoleucyl-tRNA synthetase
MYLLGSPVMHGEDILISEEAYRNQVKGTMLILWNVYNFFLSNAIIDNWEPGQETENRKQKTSNILDQWIESLLNRLVEEVTADLDAYDTVGAIDKLKLFIDDLSTWYIRRSRDRVGPAADDKADKEAFYQTTYEVLLTLSKLMAPITPFLSEAVYKNLTGEESVHLTDWPGFAAAKVANELEAQMVQARKIAELAHAKRKEQQIKVRQPLSALRIMNNELRMDEELLEVLKDELNVKKIEIQEGKGELVVELDTQITPELKAEGEARDIIRKIQEERKRLQTKQTEQIDVMLEDWPESFTDEIKRKTLIRTLNKGSFAVTPIA